MIQLKNVDRSYKTGAGQTWVLRRVNAWYGTRTLQLRDGWLVGDTANPALAQSGEAVRS
jgi:hypothetical protein